MGPGRRRLQLCRWKFECGGSLSGARVSDPAGTAPALDAGNAGAKGPPALPSNDQQANDPRIPEEAL